MDQVIVGLMRPTMFTTQLTIKNNTTEKTIHCPTEILAETLIKLSEEYNIYNIQLKGPHSYISNFVKQIKDKELLKYDCNKLNIDLI